MGSWVEKRSGIGRVYLDPSRLNEYLKSPEWNERRKKALWYYDWKCQKCGRRKNLRVEHLTLKHLGGERMRELTVLCNHC